MLGENELVCGFTVSGAPDGADLLHLLLEIINLVEMTQDGHPDIREYPNGKGKGGHGWQIYQPLTESWIVGGTWPRIPEPCTRIVLSSCKPYEIKRVENYLACNLGAILKKGEFPL